MEVKKVNTNIGISLAELEIYKTKNPTKYAKKLADGHFDKLLSKNKVEKDKEDKEEKPVKAVK